MRIEYTLADGTNRVRNVASYRQDLCPPVWLGLSRQCAGGVLVKGSVKSPWRRNVLADAVAAWGLLFPAAR